jgi:transcriptional regulator with XRE-family HTH domain
MKPQLVKETPLQEGSQQLATNLCQLLKSHHLNAGQLAQALEIPMMTIRRLMSGETTDPRISTLKLIADYFKISIDALTGENKMTMASLNKAKPYFVPLIDWETAEKINTVHELDLNKWGEWQSVSLDEQDTLSENAFALASRPSMYTRFPQGTLFIVEPNATPTDGDIVLVRIKKNNELTLRELSIDSPDWRLNPVISGSTILQYSKHDHDFTGVILLTLFYNRKANN